MQRHKADMCRFGDYDLHDLIELDQQTVGVMIQADAETCQVLTNRNAVSHHPVPVQSASQNLFQFFDICFLFLFYQDLFDYCWILLT